MKIVALERFRWLSIGIGKRSISYTPLATSIDNNDDDVDDDDDEDDFTFVIIILF